MQAMATNEGDGGEPAERGGKGGEPSNSGGGAVLVSSLSKYLTTFLK